MLRTLHTKTLDIDIHCPVRDSGPYLLQMGLKRRGLSIMVVILLHTYHFTGFFLSVSTDRVSIKGLKDAFKQYPKQDCNNWQIP